MTYWRLWLCISLFLLGVQIGLDGATWWHQHGSWFWTGVSAASTAIYALAAYLESRR
jgi:hypothetical protein